MPADIKSFEVDRLLNMVRAFGWVLTSQQIVGDEIQVTIKKTVAEVPPIGGGGA
jgi:hypothetical protein